MTDLFKGTSGPRDAKIILVGEAYGEEEHREGRPFVGTSGWFLNKMLKEAGLDRDSILCTNVINKRPPGNNFDHFLVSKEQAKGAKSVFGIRAGAELHEGVETLEKLIQAVNPSLIIAAGNWPLWALSTHAEVKTVKGYQHPTGIANWRGSQSYSRVLRSDGSRIPLLPIYHPAAITREYKLRAITVHDLTARAARVLRDPSTWTPPVIWVQHKPDYVTVLQFLQTFKEKYGWLSVDIETYRRRWISCVGLADSARSGICIPFFSFSPEGRVIPYWTPEQETTIWSLLSELLHDPRTKIIGQNFGYDTQFFYRWYDIHALVSFDTMVAHHLLYPGTPKGLDDLASLYCDHYCFWKKESQDWDTREFGAEAHWLYNVKDCLYTFEVAMELREILRLEKMEDLYAFQMEQWKLARQMTLRGIGFDQRYINQCRKDVYLDRARTAQWLEDCMPENIRFAPSGIPWFQSPTYMAKLFYDTFKFPIKLHKKTKKPTMDDSALLALQEQIPWLTTMFTHLQHLRSLDVFSSHFLEARPGADGKMHCQFNPAHVETFRWSSSATGFGEGTNLQNVPKPVED
jgi:uracil-DNA glycosylase